MAVRVFFALLIESLKEIHNMSMAPTVHYQLCIHL
jgi:hypothetical protein